MSSWTLEQRCALMESLAGAADLDAVLALLAAEIDRLALVDGYTINLRDADGSHLVSRKIRFTEEFRYLEKTYLGATISLLADSHNTAVRAFHEGVAARLRADEGPATEKVMLARWKVEEFAALPLMDARDGAALGTLVLMKRHGRIADDSLDALAALAALFAPALHRALDRAALQEFHDRFQSAADDHARALEFIIEINNLTVLDRIFEKFAGDIFRRLGFECISFFLVEDGVLKNKMVQCADARHREIGAQWFDYLRERPYQLNSFDGGVAHAVVKNTTLVFPDVQAILHLPMSEKDTQTMRILQTPRTLLVEPIRYQNEAIGALIFFSLNEPVEVSEAERSLLEKLASFLGAAVINSHHFALSRAQNVELERLATHDVLTGLPNRTLLRDRLQQGLARWQRHGQQATVAFIDLDHFKAINDTLGHSAGDRALIAVTDKLRRCIRQTDTVARFGGDEFVMILDDAGNGGGHELILQRVLDVLSEPMWDGGNEITMTCSIGYSRYPDDGADADSLLNAADAAMYLAKQLGRSNIQFYTPDMRVEAGKRLMLENKLRHAAENHELLLHYQPKADLRTGRIVGVEALVRWQHPELGMISPGVFIPIAEESGLIVPIGDWILRTACMQALAWQQAGLAVPVAVNLSARQFQAPDIAERVKHALDDVGLDPRYLELELTESMSMGNPERSIAIMQTFKALGITLTIDDFGTGYSNLSYLKRFPVDKLKLDQSFVREITQSPEALAISQAVLAVAHSLHLKVVAEGVETAPQLQRLIENHCDEMQGYYLSRPLPSDACTEFLQQGHALALNPLLPAGVAA